MYSVIRPAPPLSGRTCKVTWMACSLTWALQGPVRARSLPTGAPLQHTALTLLESTHEQREAKAQKAQAGLSGTPGRFLRRVGAVPTAGQLVSSMTEALLLRETTEPVSWQKVRVEPGEGEAMAQCGEMVPGAAQEGPAAISQSAVPVKSTLMVIWQAVFLLRVEAARAAAAAAVLSSHPEVQAVLAVKAARLPSMEAGQLPQKETRRTASGLKALEAAQDREAAAGGFSVTPAAAVKPPTVAALRS